MSVGFTLAVVEGLRYNKVPVTFEPGWETRGNGYVFPNGRPKGLLTHHTGSDYDTGLTVLRDGRPDLDPPLCNCCTFSTGRIHILGAHPANHAGASGGRSMGPLPVTSLFNREVWGNEVMYPGSTPWTPQQYRSARVLAGVICGILGVDAEHARAHAETSRTGKWDVGAGLGPGVTFDMAKFRREIWSALTTPQRRENLMPYRLDPTPIPTGATPDQKPDGTWEAVEDTITTPGPVGGWSGRVIMHLTFGYRGGFVQEAWSGPSGKHYVPRYDPTKKTGGQYVPGFTTQGWELPVDDRFLVVRYATRSRGSVTPETER